MTAKPSPNLPVDLHRRAVSVVPVAWGDSRATWHVTLGDGSAVAARRYRGADGVSRAERAARRFEAFAAAGIAVPSPVDVRLAADGSGWLLLPWIDGLVGARTLADDGGAERLAAAMGALSTQIAAVDPSGLDLDPTWASDDGLRAAVSGWLEIVADGLEPGAWMALERDATRATDGWDHGPQRTIGVVHGDFAPINVIVRRDGSLVLLDMDEICLGPRLLDLAWWAWIVRFHHRAAWVRAGSTLLDAAGVESSRTVKATAAAMVRLRLLQRAAAAPDERTRVQWLERLRETMRW